MTTPFRLIFAACLAGLVLTGCGSQPTMPLAGARALGPMAALAAKKLDDKLFADLEARKKATRKADVIELHARNKAIRAELVTKKGEIDEITINRKDLVKKGELVVSDARSWIMDTEATKKEQRRQSIVKALELLAKGLEKAEVEKADADDLKKVVASLERFVKAQKAEKKKKD